MGHPRMLHLRGFSLLLPELLVIRGPRTAIVVTAPPLLLLIPLPLNLQSWCTTFGRRRGRCPIPLLHFVAVLNRGSIPPRIYPRVDAVESEVADCAAALHRRSNTLSAVLPCKIRRYAVADQPQPVNPSFSRLAGASAVGSKRWGSITFAEMERLVRLFWCRLEATSSSLWMMSGILALLKRDGFNPSTPGLFNTAIVSVSASLVFQARTADSGSAFLRSKRRESLLAHSKVLIPEPQKRALIVTPGSVSGLFDEPLLDLVAAQVKEDFLVSSSLAVSKALSSRSGSKPLAVSSSPLAGPSGYRHPRPAQQSGKRSASSLRFGRPKRFKGGKGSAPPSSSLAGPSGYHPPCPAQRSRKRSVSSSRSGGRKRFKGGKGSAPSWKPSGFRK